MDGALLKQQSGYRRRVGKSLRDFSPLGVLTGSGDLLFILETIRWARDKKPSA